MRKEEHDSLFSVEERPRWCTVRRKSAKTGLGDAQKCVGELFGKKKKVKKSEVDPSWPIKRIVVVSRKRKVTGATSKSRGQALVDNININKSERIESVGKLKTCHNHV